MKVVSCLVESVFTILGTILITDDNAIPILAIAEFLKIEDLQRRINDYLAINISRTTVLQILKIALEIRTGDIIERCILVLARNFSQVCEVPVLPCVNSSLIPP